MSESSIDLPQELVDETLSHLGYPALDTATLVSSSLVCRSWLTSSRRILLQRVSLTKTNIDGFKELLTSNPVLAFYIRGIEVSHTDVQRNGALSWLNSASWIFGQVERLEHLSMSNISWPAADEDSKAYFCNQLSHVLPTVTSLALRRMIFTNRLELEHFILAFPNLKSVVCSATSWEQSSSPTQSILHFHLQNPPITYIRWKRGLVMEVLDTLCQNPNTKLEELVLGLKLSAEVPRLCRLLQLYKTSLRKLTLGDMAYPALVELDRVLQRTPIPLSLDRLSLGDLSTEVEANQLMSSTILLALSSPKLRSLTLRVVDGFDGNDAYWKALDKILSNNDTFRALTTLNVECVFWDRLFEDLANDFVLMKMKIKLLMPNMSSRPGFEILCHTIF